MASSKIRKEDLVQKIAANDNITQGTVCVLTCVEPCMGYEIYKNAQTHKLELRPRPRKCLHLYHYFMHPQFGLTGARIQTWFPFHVQVWINGRSYLARQMDQAQMAYRRRDNCFTWIEDFVAAQRLFDRQLQTDWTSKLRGVGARLFPNLEELLPPTRWFPFPLEYQWSVHQSEWATDITFDTRQALQALYPHLVRHAVDRFGPGDILRFLGRRLNVDGRVPGNFNGEVTLDAKERPEGTRLKFWIDRNSGKMYDKGNNLRFETTINDPRPFKVFRRREGDPEGPLSWLPMRKGIADLRRRAEVSQAANERMIEAQAAVSQRTSLGELSAALCRPAHLAGRARDGQPRPSQRFRGLNPFSMEDANLLTAIARPEFTQNGFRNRDLCTLLFPKAASGSEASRRRSGQVTRRLRLLRAHGLIRKVPRTHRYMVSEKGRRAITALLAARNSDTESLVQMAA